MLVTIKFTDCTATFEAPLVDTQTQKPILTRIDLDNYSNESEAISDCGLTEIEYAFHTQDKSPMSKIEFDLGERGEVTSFVSLNQRKSVTPFVMGDDINFRSVEVKVVNPQNQILAEGTASAQ